MSGPEDYLDPLSEAYEQYEKLKLRYDHAISDLVQMTVKVNRYKSMLSHCCGLLRKLSSRNISERDSEDAEVTADQIENVLKKTD